MSTRVRTIIAGVFFTVLVLVGTAVAVLTALKQTPEKPAAPTVPQVTPEAKAPATTPACTLTFTVGTAQTAICDKLTADPTEGTAPLTVNFSLSGHATPSGTIVNYKFDFGDGSTPVGQTGNTISHSFTFEGAFTVKGTVVDDKGNTAGGSGDCQKTVTVGHTVYKFNKCENNACVQKDCVPNTTPCPGLSTCQTDDDCKGRFQHRVCLGNTCSLVDCSPPTVACGDSCSSDADCAALPPSPPATPSATHRECRNQACVVIAGAGTSTCTSDVSCKPAAAIPPIPRSGNTLATFGGIALGVGVLLVGLLILL